MKNKEIKENKAPRQSIGRIIANNLRMYAKVARLTPEFFIITVLKGLFFGANASAEAVFTVKLFDAIDGGASFSEVSKIIGFMALFYVIFYIFNAWHRQYLHPMLQQKLVVEPREEKSIKLNRRYVKSSNMPVVSKHR